MKSSDREFAVTFVLDFEYFQRIEPLPERAITITVDVMV